MPGPLPYTDLELLTQIVQGDEPAFNELFARYREKLFRYLLKLTHSREMSEEIVIDIFVKIWVGRALLTQVNSVEGFLITVAKNKGLDILRTTARTQRLQQQYETLFAPDNTKTADEIMVDAELMALWTAAINELPPQQRRVYALRHQENMTYDEIAEAMRLSRNTVRNHLHAATTSIADRLKKQHPPDTALSIFFLL